jgi:hypothetical protein
MITYQMLTSRATGFTLVFFGALVNCWKPIYVQGCTSLTKVFDDQSVVNKMRDMLKKSCAQKEGTVA